MPHATADSEPVAHDSEATPGLRASDPGMGARDLTLIVAATNRMGIGRNGTLPWTGLRNEMAYFARVTKRANAATVNAVIMGRKTWDSIPPRFRPLKDRMNIVITRQWAENQTGYSDSRDYKAGSMDAALRLVGATVLDRRGFVIGGAEIYKAALERQEAKRILLTRVLTEFECDTTFPVQLNEDGTADGWERKTKEELDRWVGETVPEGVQEENGTRYVFEMWERP